MRFRNCVEFRVCRRINYVEKEENKMAIPLEYIRKITG